MLKIEEQPKIRFRSREGFCLAFLASVFPGMRTIFASLLVAVICLVRPVLAAPANSFSQDYANDVINVAVNTNTLFASQDLISNGKFLQRRTDQPDTQYETFRLPVEIPLGDKDAAVRPFFQSSGALLKVTSGVTAPPGDGEDDFSISHLFALTAGTGAYVRLAKGFFCVPGLAVSFAHLLNKYDFNNSYSQAVLENNNKEFFDWSMDLFTYSPSMKFIYEFKIGEGEGKYTVGYSHLFNNSIVSTSNKIDVNSASGLLIDRIEFSQPVGIEVAGGDLSLRPFFQWSNINGKAASGLGFVNMFEVGADLLTKLKETFVIFSEVYIGASYVSADSFEGYHIGFGGHF